MSKRKIKFVIALLCLFNISPGWSQGRIDVESQVDRSAINIGDVITYNVVVTHDKDVQLDDLPLATNLGAFEIRDYLVHDPFEQEGQIVEKIDYLISTFDTGEYIIPAINIQYRLPKDSLIHSIKTEPISIMVESLNPDEEGEIRDIKAPLAPDADYTRLVMIGGLILLLLLLAIFGFVYIKRRREGKSLFPQRAEPPRPAHLVAVEALDNLMARDLLEQNKVKEFYIELSEIVRTYINGRYFIDALEMTTMELIEQMKIENIDHDPVEKNQEILELADLVKFAKYKPLEKVSLRAVKMAREMIEITKIELIVADTDQTDQEAFENIPEPIVASEIRKGEITSREEDQ